MRNLLLILLLLNGGSPLNAQSVARETDLPVSLRTVAGLTLNRDSALSIVATLGPTASRMVGSGHDVFRRWCYVGPDSVLLELLSDRSDMGTPGQALNIIRLRARPPASALAGCARLRVGPALSTAGGLALGINPSDAYRILGRRPSRQTTDSMVFEFSAKEYMKPGSPEYRLWNTPEYRKSCFDGDAPFSNAAATVILRFREGRTTEVRLERYDQATC